MKLDPSVASQLGHKYYVDTDGLILNAEYFDSVEQLESYLEDADTDWRAIGMDRIVSTEQRRSMLIAYALGLRFGVNRSYASRP